MKVLLISKQNKNPKQLGIAPKKLKKNPLTFLGRW
jgi:hypothetical protein